MGLKDWPLLVKQPMASDTGGFGRYVSLSLREVFSYRLPRTGRTFATSAFYRFSEASVWSLGPSVWMSARPSLPLGGWELWGSHLKVAVHALHVAQHPLPVRTPGPQHLVRRLRGRWEGGGGRGGGTTQDAPTPMYVLIRYRKELVCNENQACVCVCRAVFRPDCLRAKKDAPVSA